MWTQDNNFLFLFLTLDRSIIRIRIISRKLPQHLTNWMKCDKGNVVWNSANSLKVTFSLPLSSYLRVEFYCGVTFTCVYTHVNFNHVNKIEARYKELSINVNLIEVQLLLLLMPHFMHCLYFICGCKFYTCAHVKITRQWRQASVQ